MPTLLATLEKQNEDADEDDWNLSQSAAVCIQQMAITTEVSRRWGEREIERGGRLHGLLSFKISHLLFQL